MHFKILRVKNIRRDKSRLVRAGLVLGHNLRVAYAGRRILREWDFWRWIALSLLFRRVLRVGVKDKSRLVRAGCGIEGNCRWRIGRINYDLSVRVVVLRGNCRWRIGRTSLDLSMRAEIVEADFEGDFVYSLRKIYVMKKNLPYRFAFFELHLCL
jgi:hypothetical protein